MLDYHKCTNIGRITWTTIIFTQWACLLWRSNFIIFYAHFLSNTASANEPVTKYSYMRKSWKYLPGVLRSNFLFWGGGGCSNPEIFLRGRGVSYGYLSLSGGLGHIFWYFYYVGFFLTFYLFSFSYSFSKLLECL